MENNSWEVLNTFTKDMGELKISLGGVNEVAGVKSGFIIMYVDTIEIKYNKESTSDSVGIFLYQKDTLVAKDFIFFFKDTDKLTFNQMYIKGKETDLYSFKYIEE